MSIWTLKAGLSARVTSIVNCSEEFILRLSEIGISVGTEVYCVKETPFGGPKVFSMSDSVFSLDQELASKIIIA